MIGTVNKLPCISTRTSFLMKLGTCLLFLTFFSICIESITHAFTKSDRDYQGKVIWDVLCDERPDSRDKVSKESRQFTVETDPRFATIRVKTHSYQSRGDGMLYGPFCGGGDTTPYTWGGKLDDAIRYQCGECPETYGPSGAKEEALLNATHSGKNKLALSLIAQGAFVNAKSNYLRTPLMEAIVNCSFDVVEALVSRGAHINDKDKAGTTPLMYAVFRGDLQIIRFLIGKGADVNAKNNSGETPIERAHSLGDYDMEQMLKSQTHSVADSNIEKQRFVINNDGTINDTRTGLIWQREANDEEMNWYDANRYCARLELAGYTDWRMPTHEEFLTIINRNNWRTNKDTGKSKYAFDSDVFFIKPVYLSDNLYAGFWTSSEIYSDIYKEQSYYSINYISGTLIQNNSKSLSENKIQQLCVQD